MSQEVKLGGQPPMVVLKPLRANLHLPQAITRLTIAETKGLGAFSRPRAMRRIATLDQPTGMTAQSRLCYHSDIAEASTAYTAFTMGKARREGEPGCVVIQMRSPTAKLDAA